MSEYKRKSHNKTNLVYHLVCVVKYRKNVLTEEVENTITNVCLEIQEKYKITFVEIGTDINHIHYLIQTPPKYSPTQIVTMIKSFTARRVFEVHPKLRDVLYGGEFWSDGYWMTTVSQNISEKVIKDYVKKQGNGKYHTTHKKDDVRDY